MASKKQIEEYIQSKVEDQKKKLRQQLSMLGNINGMADPKSKEVKLIYLNLAKVSLDQLIEEVTNE